MRALLFLLCLPLLAEDKPTVITTPTTGNQDGSVVRGCPATGTVITDALCRDYTEAKAQIAQRDAQIAKLTRKVEVYQRSAFQCQDAMLDQQIEAQAKQQQKKPEGK